MKLHLPVRLFKSVLTCLSAVAVGLTLGSASVTAAETQLDHSPEEEELLLYPAPLTLTSSAVSLAAYTPPSEITIPTGYTEVLVDDVSDITPYSSSATDVAFRLTADVTVDGRTSAIMTSYADSWYFTSDSVDNLRALSFSNATARLFYVSNSKKLELDGLAGVTFIANSNSYFGGAIRGDEHSTITLSGNESVTFSENSAHESGGAIFGYSNSTITLSGNGSVAFRNNVSTGVAYSGGAIDGYSGSTITLSGNGSVIISGNSAGTGGAIAICGSIEIVGNGEVIFSENKATSTGGAIRGLEHSTITMNNNGSVIFRENKAVAYGGAIYELFGSTMELNNNDIVEFCGNSASSTFVNGGAIHGDIITLRGNGRVTFSCNTASSTTSYVHGGAIYSIGFFTIAGNDEVTFAQNVEKSESVYRLRSLYLTGNRLTLSAGANQSIRFYDSIYKSASGSVELNADYIDDEGVTHKQSGDIIFSGAYTEQHLNELLAADGLTRTATAEEILNSRTSEVKVLTNLHGGRLRVESGAVYKGCGIMVHEASAAMVQVENATLNHSGYNLTFNSGTTLSLSGSNSISGNILLNKDSYLKLNIQDTNRTSPLAIFSSASLTLNGKINIVIETDSSVKDGVYYQLFSGISKPSSWTDANVNLILPNNCVPSTSVLTWNDNILTFYCDYPSSVTWNNASGSGKWDVSSLNWTEDGGRIAYAHHAAVTFGNAGAGEVSLIGTLTPQSVTVNNDSGYNYTWQGSGKLSGAMKLYKKGAGTLTIKNTNTFTGGTEITGGKVVLNAENALGTGAISVSDAELSATSRINAQGLTLKSSKMTQTGGGTGLTLKSSMNMENSDLVLKAPLNGTFLTMTKGSTINMLDSCTRNITLSGTLNATDSDITMYGHTQTNNLTLKNSSYTSVGGASRDLKVSNTLSLSSGAKLRHHGAIHAKNVSLNSSNITQTGGGKGLYLSGALSMSNKSTVSLKGPLTAASVTLAGSSVLDSVDQYSRQVTLSGSMSATDSTVKLYGNVEMNALTLKNSAFDMNGKYTRSLTLKSGSTFTNSEADLYGFLTGTNLTLNNSTLNQRGGSAGLQLSGALSMSNNAVLNLKSPLKAASVSLGSGSKLNMQDSVTRAITLTGSMSATKATVNHYGKLKAANLTLTDSTYNCTGRYATGMDISGTTKLTNSKLDIYGYLNSKNLTLSKGRVRQSGTGNVTISGTLSMNSGSSLTTSGTLSAGTMTLSGGTINLTAGSLKTITVNNTLTLNSAIDLNLGCSLKQGVIYKLVSFKKTNLTNTSNLASLLGMSGSGATLTLGSNSITLKVTNSTAWNKYVAANKSLFNSTTTAMMPEVEEEEEILTTSVAETTEAVAAFDRSGADALVQSNWGMLNASRAFTDTIGNRASNRRALGEEQKSSVWMSAMGASSRLSSDGVAAGSDFNLFGAAFGMEQQLTEKSSLGLAIGNSRGKVSSFTSGRTKQDMLHTALYGQHLLQQSTSDALTLDWSAAYGRTESRWNSIEWDQRALQLDARATYAHQLNDTTTVSAFAGLQYYASDSATVAKGCESGSIQNLRGEIGVGIGHRATSKTSIYGELSFVGDMARNNPTATIGEHRVRGANPGRAGINLSAGVNHALNEKWSVNASYNMELMERANSHSANIGASYKF